MKAGLIAGFFIDRPLGFPYKIFCTNGFDVIVCWFCYLGSVTLLPPMSIIPACGS